MSVMGMIALVIFGVICFLFGYQVGRAHGSHECAEEVIKGMHEIFDEQEARNKKNDPIAAFDEWATISFVTDAERGTAKDAWLEAIRWSKAANEEDGR